MSKLLYIFAILLFAHSYSIAGKFDHQITFYNLEEIQDSLALTFPINSKREAIEFAKQSGLFEKPPYEDLKKHGIKKWFALVKKKGKIWYVVVRSDIHIIPSYSCGLAFKDDGTISKLLSKDCGFNK